MKFDFARNGGVFLEAIGTTLYIVATALGVGGLVGLAPFPASANPAARDMSMQVLTVAGRGPNAVGAADEASRHPHSRVSCHAVKSLDVV